MNHYESPQAALIKPGYQHLLFGFNIYRVVFGLMACFLCVSLLVLTWVWGQLEKSRAIADGQEKTIKKLMSQLYEEPNKILVPNK